MKQSSLKNKYYLMISIAIILIVWQIVAIIINNSLLLPSFFDILNDLVHIIFSKNFLILVGSSMYRCIQSFIISIVIAILLAILSYYSKFIYNFSYIVLVFIKSVPTMAFIILILIWTSKEFAPIIIGIMISLPIFYDVIINTLINIDKELINMCKIYNIPLLDRIKTIIIPVVFIAIEKVVSSTLSLVFKVVISGEVYSQPQYGIGSIIQLEKINLNTSAIIAWMLIITMIVYSFDFFISKILLLINYLRRGKNANK